MPKSKSRFGNSPFSNAKVNSSSSRDKKSIRVSFQRHWWLHERRAVALDLFRILSGVSLLAYFADVYTFAPALLESHGFYNPVALSSVASVTTDSWLASGLTVSMLRSIFGLSIVGALGITLGIFPRICAGLLFILSISLYRAIFPITHLDDCLVTSTLFFLVLLPIGKTLFVSKHCLQTQTWRDWARLRVKSSVANLFLLYILGLYLNVWLWNKYTPTEISGPVIVGAICSVPVLLIIPGTITTALAIIVQLALHLFLLPKTGLVFTNMVLLSSAVLFWGEKIETTPEKPHNVAPLLSASTTTAAGYLLILSIYYLAAIFSATSPLIGTRKILGDAGLLPLASAQKLDRFPITISIGETLGKSKPLRIPNVDSKHIRIQLLFSILKRTGKAIPKELYKSIIARTARHHCHKKEKIGQKEKIFLTSTGYNSGEAIAQILCTKPFALPVIEM